MNKSITVVIFLIGILVYLLINMPKDNLLNQNNIKYVHDEKAITEPFLDNESDIFNSTDNFVSVQLMSSEDAIINIGSYLDPSVININSDGANIRNIGEFKKPNIEGEYFQENTEEINIGEYISIDDYTHSLITNSSDNKLQNIGNYISVEDYLKNSQIDIKETKTKNIGEYIKVDGNTEEK